MDYSQFYDLESYFSQTLRPRFLAHGSLSAFDFFCIVVWKANRAKSRIARRLLAPGYENLDVAVRELTSQLAKQATAKDRLRYLLEDWGFRLPIASAILAVLYPDEFTVYDQRVCGILGAFEGLADVGSFDRLWDGYQEYVHAVGQAAPKELTLRDKDRYLWGKSIHDQLRSDIEDCFGAGRVSEA